MKNIE